MNRLHADAAAAGIQREWTDADGRAHQVADEVLEAILARLDLTPPAEPMVTADRGQPLALPSPLAGHEGELQLEGGGRRVVTVGTDASLAGVAEVGLHRLAIAGRMIPLAVAPARCPAPPAVRCWGAAVQITALRATRPSAFGDFGALASTARTAAAAGAQALAIGPTHSLFPADARRISAYSPSSRRFRNMLLGDPETIGWSIDESAGGALIDWSVAAPRRLAALRAAWAAAPAGVTDAVAAFAAQQGPALETQALFDAIHARLGGEGWQDWPRDLHDPVGDAAQAFAREHGGEVAFFRFGQWLAETSLAAAGRAAREAMSIGLIADLAVGVHAGGSDGWARRNDLLDGLSIGAPPDPLGPDGQDWGIAALDPFALRRAGYAPFLATLRSAFAHAGGLRIDHALGLERLWVIPPGGTAADGAYLAMPGEDLRRLVAIEADRARAIVIGEDLGTVPPGFRDRLAARGMLGMRVLPFERDEDGAFTLPAEWDAAAVAMTGTHDTPTIAGWWRGRDLDWRRDLGRLAPADQPAERRRRDGERARLWQALGGTAPPPTTPPVDALIAHVSHAPAPLAIVPMEDLLAEEEQPNIPGTVDEHPNWRRRLPAASDALIARADVATRTAFLTAERPG